MKKGIKSKNTIDDVINLLLSFRKELKNDVKNSETSLQSEMKKGFENAAKDLKEVEENLKEEINNLARSTAKSFSKY